MEARACLQYCPERNVYTLNTLITLSLATLIIGFIVGTIIGLRKSPAKKAEELEQHLSEMQQQQENYQHEVTEHFTQTAELLDKLTNSYRDVHNHLAQGAQALTGESNNLQAIDSNQNETDQLTHSQNEFIAPPLDYAPKSDDQVGMLNEEFGLSKNGTDNSEDEEPPITGAATS
jgi:uncharacterized membrane-anchored protein YhcB (DUF1043 family)